MLGATALVIGFTQFFLALTYHAPEPVPAVDPKPADLGAGRTDSQPSVVARPTDGAALSGR